MRKSVDSSECRDDAMKHHTRVVSLSLSRNWKKDQKKHIRKVPVKEGSSINISEAEIVVRNLLYHVNIFILLRRSFFFPWLAPSRAPHIAARVFLVRSVPRGVKSLYPYYRDSPLLSRSWTLHTRSCAPPKACSEGKCANKAAVHAWHRENRTWKLYKWQLFMNWMLNCYCYYLLVERTWLVLPDMFRWTRSENAWKSESAVCNVQSMHTFRNVLYPYQKGILGG